MSETTTYVLIAIVILLGVAKICFLTALYRLRLRRWKDYQLMQGAEK